MSRCVPFTPPGFMWNGVSGTDLSKLIKVRRKNAIVEKMTNKEKRRSKKDNEELKKRDIRERVCALFPPPMFAWNGVSDETLSRFIKVIREKIAVEKKRKKKKKEEKRRRKNENEELENGEIKEIVCISSSHKYKNSKKCEKTSSHEHEKHVNKLLELERSSCLTEEHEQPITTICCDQTNSLMYDSSDNTENFRPKFVTPDKSRLAAASKSMLSTTTFVDDHENVESRFTELIVNFAPPPPPFIQTEQLYEFDDDDQEWLFERRLPRRNPPAVSSAFNDDDSCPGSSSMYPCPRYLLEADIYAMPYTMLF
ncbi:hypothetical protein Ddye_004156 [Dipteronia dyeriana]|uniref:Uncharacterized protein n=1 Tax=Dipteronia dyeriana TaxID=168575 RepID=A0AAD9XUU5_9ROSI|nr:hypothetical protein Ddye_004156 [Dipteronia dyeriana]